MNWIDKIYIISLEKHQNRREFITMDLDSAGFDMSKVEWITAVNGNELDINECLTNGTISDTFLDPNGILTKGIYGCALSHQLVYKKFLETPADIQNCLILEDDASVAHTLFRVMRTNSFGYEKFLEEKDTFDWDVILMGGQEKRMEYEDTDSYILKTTKRYPLNYAAHSYMITKKGAEKLIDSNTPIRFAADVNIHCSTVNLFSTPSSYFLQKQGDFDKWMAAFLEQKFTHYILNTKVGWDMGEVISNTTFGDYIEDENIEPSYKTAQISDKIEINSLDWKPFTAPNNDVIEGWSNIHLKIENE